MEHSVIVTGAGDAQSEDLVCHFDVSLLVARLIPSNGSADAAELLVAVLGGVRCCVAMADLCKQQNMHKSALGTSKRTFPSTVGQSSPRSSLCQHMVDHEEPCMMTASIITRAMRLRLPGV